MSEYQGMGEESCAKVTILFGTQVNGQTNVDAEVKRLRPEGKKLC